MNISQARGNISNPRNKKEPLTTRDSATSLDPNANYKYRSRPGMLESDDLNDPLLPLKIEKRYNFKFSSNKDLAGNPSCCRVITIILLIVATLFLPVAIIIDKNSSKVHWIFPWNSWLIYVLIVNTTVLMLLGC